MNGSHFLHDPARNGFDSMSDSLHSTRNAYQQLLDEKPIMSFSKEKKKSLGWDYMLRWPGCSPADLLKKYGPVDGDLSKDKRTKIPEEYAKYPLSLEEFKAAFDNLLPE